MKLNLTNVGMIAGAAAVAFIIYKKMAAKNSGYVYVNSTQYQPVWAGDEGAKKTTGGLTWI